MSRGELEGVTKSYGRHRVVCDVSLAVGASEIVGLIGPNGAGKTTLLRLFAGLIRPTRGVVHIPTADRPAVVRYFAGEHSLPPDVRTNRWLALWSAPTMAGANGRRIAGTLGTLSRGTRQRVGLEAMLADPDVTLLLLDEPWEGLDPDASRWLSEELLKRREAGAGVIVSSHRIHDLADVCDRCVFLVDGRLSPESLAVSARDGVGDRSALLFTAFDHARRPR